MRVVKSQCLLKAVLSMLSSKIFWPFCSNSGGGDGLRTACGES